MYEKIDSHNRNLDRRIESVLNRKCFSNNERSKIKEFLRLSSIGKINLRKKVGNARLIKYLDLIKIPFGYFKKDADKISLKDMEDFIEKLEKAKLKGFNKKPYADNTQADIKRMLKIYLKWRLNQDKYNTLTNWIDLSVKNKTPEYLKEEEINKLFKACKSNKERFIIAVFFDSGCRAEEFLNIRYEDILEPNSNFSYYKIHFKEEYSKTKGRTIGLYWKNSTDSIKDYLEEIKGIKPSDPIISDKYDAIRFFIIRLGKRVLKRRVHPHLFRHSSATYYADKLNRQQLCIRYGWNFTSKMPDVYISRAGLDETDLQEKFKNTDIEDLKSRLEKAEHLLKIVLDQGKDTFKSLEKKV